MFERLGAESALMGVCFCPLLDLPSRGAGLCDSDISLFSNLQSIVDLDD